MGEGDFTLGGGHLWDAWGQWVNEIKQGPYAGDKDKKGIRILGLSNNINKHIVNVLIKSLLSFTPFLLFFL